MTKADLLEQVSDSNRRIKSMVGDLNEVKIDLKSMLDWSQRIGSDERHHLQATISVINRSLKKIK
jgi:regulator of replication initiation timing